MFNSFPPSAAYMRQWIDSTFVQIMACHLFGTKPLSDQMLLNVNWTPGNKFQWNLNRNSIIFIQENALENVVCTNGSHFIQGEMSQCLIQPADGMRVTGDSVHQGNTSSYNITHHYSILDHNIFRVDYIIDGEWLLLFIMKMDDTSSI